MAAAAVAAAGAAHAQQPGVTVLGGGLAQACSDAVNHGETGPRIDQICTQALDTEALLADDRAGTFVNRGVVRIRDQRYPEAIKDFDIAIALKPRFGEAYANRGAARIGAHQFKEAIADLDTALSMNVLEPQKAYYNRALAYEWLDNPKAAWLDYNKALELAPDWDLVKEQLTRFTVSHPASVTAPAAAAPAPPAPPTRP
jgi:tetratricopeptide (TPR) repeat protein